MVGAWDDFGPVLGQYTAEVQGFVMMYVPLTVSISFFFTFTTLWVNSADDELIIFLLFFPENKV